MALPAPPTDPGRYWLHPNGTQVGRRCKRCGRWVPFGPRWGNQWCRMCHRHYGRMKRMSRRAQELGAYVEEVDHRKVYGRDKGVCGLCGEKVSPRHYEVDHRVPYSAGGRHEYANVHVVHAACHRVKTNAELAA